MDTKTDNQHGPTNESSCRSIFDMFAVRESTTMYSFWNLYSDDTPMPDADNKFKLADLLKIKSKIQQKYIPTININKTMSRRMMGGRR